MPTRILVSADHVHPNYRLDGKPVEVHGDGPNAEYGYYAVLSGFGCGKTRLTKADAIRELLGSNGCTNIRIGTAI